LAGATPPALAETSNQVAVRARLTARARQARFDDLNIGWGETRLRGRAVEIIHVETPDTGVSFLHPGLGKRPLHACSCAKAVAAFSPGQVPVRNLEGRLKAYTEFTLTRLEDLEAELELIRRRGYAECVEEIELGMCSVAAPLSETGPGATMSIGATGSTRVFTPAFRARMGQHIIRMARDLSVSVGEHERHRRIMTDGTPQATGSPHAQGGGR